MSIKNIVTKMRQVARKNKITDKKIREICEEVRQDSEALQIKEKQIICE